MIARSTTNDLPFDCHLACGLQVAGKVQLLFKSRHTADAGAYLSVNWKPVIAAPHGYAMGLALGLVLECHLIVAAAGTKFQVTETSRGLGGAKPWPLHKPPRLPLVRPP